MSLMKLLASRNYITVNKTLIKAFGVSEAIILGELCSEYDFWETEGKLEDDMFYCSIVKLEENTGLNDYEQRKAIKSLVNSGVLKVKLKGLPATRYFYIDKDKMYEILRSRSLNFKELDPENLKTNNTITNKNKNTKTLPKGKVAELEPSTPSPITSSEFLGSSKPKHKESMFSKCTGLINNFTDDNVLRKLLTDFLKTCLENSKESNTPFYTNNFKGKLNSLQKLSGDTEVQKQIVKQTLDNGWNGFHVVTDRRTERQKVFNQSEGKYKPTDEKRRIEQIERWKADGVDYEF